MARLAADSVLDDGLDNMKTAVDAATGWLSVCEGAPTTYEHAFAVKGTATGKVLAKVANPTLTVADGAVDGRKVTISEELAVEIVASGTADHIALVDSVNEKLWVATVCTGQALVSGGTVDVPEWVFAVRDPTAPA